jgi:hypothetical protein
MLQMVGYELGNDLGHDHVYFLHIPIFVQAFSGLGRSRRFPPPCKNTPQDFGSTPFQDLVHVHRFWGPKVSHFVLFYFYVRP